MEIDTHEQQEPEYQHMDKNTLSLVSKLLNPMSSGITVPDQGMGTGIPCLPLPVISSTIEWARSELYNTQIIVLHTTPHAPV